MSGNILRNKSIRRKLNAMSLEFKDKNVLLVDDSIVRGNTSRAIVQMARSAGARKVYFASCAPPIKYPNLYGININTYSELIAHNRSEEEIALLIGADKIFYQSLSDLETSVRQFNPELKQFETSIFTGKYITDTNTHIDITDINTHIDITKDVNEHMSMKTNDTLSQQVGLHNNYYNYQQLF